MTDFPHRQPEYLFQLIDVQHIDLKENYPVLPNSNGPAERQELSILQKFGQLRPLLVQQQTASRYCLLAGSLYFSAIKSLGIEKVFCQILPQATPPFTLFSLKVVHNFPLSQTSLILQAYLLQDAQQMLSAEELLQLLSLMGHKPQRYKLEELLSFLQLDPSAILALHRGILSPKSGKQLALLSREDQHYLVELIITYRLGGSKQQKLIEMMIELVLRENSSVLKIIEKWLPVQKKVLNNIPQQIQGLMQYLHEQCYPSNTAAEKIFKNLVQELQPPENVTIEHSHSFEDEGLELRLKFADAATLKENWGNIKMIVR